MKFALTLTFVFASCLPALAQQSETPTEQHEYLQKDVGTWTGKMSLQQGGQKVEFPIREVNTSFGNGLWLLSEFEAGPMKGRGTFGYDTHRKKFVGTWVDSANSFLNIAEGDFNEEENQLEMIYKGIDPATGQPNEMKGVTKLEGDDKRHFTMYSKAGEEWVKAFTIVYERVKE